jgi:membrane-associated phospholipid phosphatase
MMGLNSFPSGHATSAFAIFTSLALVSNNKFLKIIFFLFAFLSAFSRTYLSQHWLVDITIGSLIGTLFSLVLYFAFYQSNKLQNLNKPLFNFNKA